MRVRLGSIATVIVGLAGAPSCSSFTASDTGSSSDAGAGEHDGASDAGVTRDAASEDTSDAEAVAPPFFVQENSTSVPSASQATVSFPSDLQAHDAILVATAVYNGPSLQKLTDTQGNVYAPILGPFPGTAAGRFYLYGAFDIAAGGPDAVTVSFTGAGRLDVYVQAYRGVAATAAVDVKVATNGTSTAVDGMSSGPFTTTHPNELVFAYATAATAAAGTGFMLRSNAYGNVTEDEIAASPGTYTATATMTSGTNWTLLVATLRGR